MQTKLLLASFVGLTISVGVFNTHAVSNNKSADEHKIPKSVAEIGITETVISPIKQKLILNVTGYTANEESTGKNPGDPAYGITTSGKEAKKGITVAASKDIPFGTQLYIPYFDKAGWDNKGIFTVEDRGGAIVKGKLDIFFGYDDQALINALEFGREDLEVYILEGGIEYDYEAIRRIVTKSSKE